MKPQKPYLVRAIYDWLVDSELTPHLIVNADYPGVQVPTEYVEEGRIVLNIAPSAVADLLLSNDGISFNARFGGRPWEVYVPAAAVLGLISRENGEGMFFAQEADEPEAETDPTDPDPEPPTSPPAGGGRPTLKVVK